MEYKKDVYVDKYNLDEELIQQPQRFLDWALAWVDASDTKEVTKIKLDLIKAETESRIRKNPDKYDIPEGKATEPAIKAEVLKHKRVRRAQKKYIQALKNERKLAEIKASFRQRKSMLEKLVDLNMMLHFSEPKLPTDQKESVYQHRKRKITRRLREELNGNDD